jgi:hypothetical protein
MHQGDISKFTNLPMAGADRSIEGIDERTSPVNPDSAVDTAPLPDQDALGGSEQGGSAGPVGTFEGEGNEGAVAPLGGDPRKAVEDGQTNGQGGAASGVTAGPDGGGS